MSTIRQHTLANGMTLLTESMPHVRSATLLLLTPGGYSNDPDNQLGTASLLAEMLPRGAGKNDSRALSLALDNLGADRSESVGLYNMILSAGLPARNLPEALSFYADIVKSPHLPENDLEAAQELALQDLLGLEDSPQDLVMLELKSQYYPTPLNRNRFGTAEGIRAVTSKSLKAYHQARIRPNGAVLAVAGNIEFDSLRDQVEKLFGDWKQVPANDRIPPAPGVHKPGSCHVTKATQQTQIALAFDSVPLKDPDFYAARGAVGVMSGGMASRLFTEVREKRGLCYSVYASHDSLRDRAAIVGYAGSRTDRAQETLDVMIAEFQKLKEGITEDELARVRVTLKTSLVMQQESTSARAATMASDYFNLSRVRNVDEVAAAIESLTPASVIAYLERHPVKNVAVVTLGPKELIVPA